jgi:hypothetical protein
MSWIEMVSNRYYFLPSTWSKNRFAVVDIFVEKIYPGAERDLSRLVYAWLLTFPPRQLDLMVRLISQNLTAKGKKPITKGELVKFKGVQLLMTRYKFSSQERTL